MEVNEYKEIVKLTSLYPDIIHNAQLALSWLGLIEESEEAFDAYKSFTTIDNEENRTNVIKEVGDVCWYVTSISEILDLDLESVFKSKESIEDLKKYKNITLYSGNIKKFYRDGKPIDKKEIQGTLSLLMLGMLSALKNYDITLDLILKTNYDKLILRKQKGTIKGDGDNR
jgi:NTP pyrophosphatase (non-canonical NTP hydrolase)